MRTEPNPLPMQAILSWAVALVVVAGMLVRPWRTREWMWAVGGGLLLVGARAVTPLQAWHAVARGGSVYAFLIGILGLAAAARYAGLFERLATIASRAARGSRRRLFALVFAAGVLVTAALSNDTAAVVLAPAVLAVLAPTGLPPLPYLLACAFVANSASLLFPFSNPANIVVYDGRLPSLWSWLHTFWPAAVAGIAATFAVLYLVVRRDLSGPRFAIAQPHPPMTRRSWVALGAVVGVVAAMLVATALRGALGPVTLVAALVACALVTLTDRPAGLAIARGISWQVIPLVAGLFVVVDALGHAGALARAHAALALAAHLGWPLGPVAAVAGVALAANLFNNLPVALAAGYGGHVAPHLLATALVGIDLGPNLSVTGSLSTLLWLIVLRSEGVAISARTFARVGWLVALPALLLAAVLVR